jgi:hypothetical protein
VSSYDDDGIKGRSDERLLLQIEVVRESRRQ